MLAHHEGVERKEGKMEGSSKRENAADRFAGFESLSRRIARSSIAAKGRVPEAPPAWSAAPRPLPEASAKPERVRVRVRPLPAWSAVRVIREGKRDGRKVRLVEYSVDSRDRRAA